MALAWRRGGVGSCACPCVGLAYESDGHKVVCGILPGKSASLPGLLCDSSYIDSTDLVCIEEVGLLDSMAFCEYRQPDTLPEGWSGVYADCKLPVPDQRSLVTVQLV